MSEASHYSRSSRERDVERRIIHAGRSQYFSSGEIGRRGRIDKADQNIFYA